MITATIVQICLQDLDGPYLLFLVSSKGENFRDQIGVQSRCKSSRVEYRYAIEYVNFALAIVREQIPTFHHWLHLWILGDFSRQWAWVEGTRMGPGSSISGGMNGAILLTEFCRAYLWG